MVSLLLAIQLLAEKSTARLLRLQANPREIVFAAVSCWLKWCVIEVNSISVLTSLFQGNSTSKKEHLFHFVINNDSNWVIRDDVDPCVKVSDDSDFEVRTRVGRECTYDLTIRISHRTCCTSCAEDSIPILLGTLNRTCVCTYPASTPRHCPSGSGGGSGIASQP